MKSLLLLALVLIMMAAAYQAQQLLRKHVRPQVSMQRLLLFFLLNFICLFLLITITGIVIIYSKDFFFKT